jgi:hypothetical protein
MPWRARHRWCATQYVRRGPLRLQDSREYARARHSEALAALRLCRIPQERALCLGVIDQSANFGPGDTIRHRTRFSYANRTCKRAGCSCIAARYKAEARRLPLWNRDFKSIDSGPAHSGRRTQNSYYGIRCVEVRESNPTRKTQMAGISSTTSRLRANSARSPRTPPHRRKLAKDARSLIHPGRRDAIRNARTAERRFLLRPRSTES